MSEALWSAVDDQARAWRGIATFQRFASQLPRNSPQRLRGVPGVLQRIQAAGAGWVSGRPMRLGLMAPMFLESIPGLNAPAADADFEAWLEDAQRVEEAHRETIAWLRSRLPGYPMLPAPQLSPGTPITTVEFTWRLIWVPGERARGHQFEPVPTNAGRAMDVTKNQQESLDETARSLAVAFEASSEWSRLESATEALDREARSNLRSSRSRIRQRLTDEAIAAHEPHFAMPRDNYRQAVVEEEIAALSGTAREYAHAFDAADRLVETAASEVFGQLAAYGEPAIVTAPQEIDFNVGKDKEVSFNVLDDSWAEIGALIWLDDPLLPDAAHIMEVTWRVDAATGEAQRVAASILAGTGLAWRHG